MCGAVDLKISKRISALEPSATLAVMARAKAMREAGVDVVALAAGQPDFDTPQHIKDAAIAALNAGDTKYVSPAVGKNELRDAVCGYFKTYGGLDYERAQIAVGIGAKDLCHQAFAAVLDPGDEVIIPVPYWVSYPEQVKLAGGVPVFVEGGDGPVSNLGPEQLRAAITPRTRMLVLNSPSNPSGKIYSRSELEALAAVLRETDIVVLSDEIYHRLTSGPQPAPSFASAPGMIERTVTINGVSKTYAMTGWRLGFAGGPAAIIEAMGKVSQQTTSGAVSFVQTAAVEALSGDQSCVETMRAAYRERGRRMWQALSAIAGIHCEEPQGGFMLFADVSGAFARLGVSSAAGFAEAVLERAHVAVIPGEAFGVPTHVRFSFATSAADIEEGMRRLAHLLGG